LVLRSGSLLFAAGVGGDAVTIGGLGAVAAIFFNVGIAEE
jgi:hypothetical protein